MESLGASAMEKHVLTRFQRTEQTESCQGGLRRWLGTQKLRKPDICPVDFFICHLPTKGGVLKTMPIIPRVCGVWTFKRRSSLIHIFAKLSLIGWPTNQNLKQSSRFLPVEAYYLHNGMGAWKNNFVHKEQFFFQTVNG